MKALQLFAVVVVVLLALASPAFAQVPSSGTQVFTGASIGAGIGAALAIVGAGYGFGKIGAAALEGMARQPEVAGRILPAMIVIAALLEGATLFALFICFTVAGKTGAGSF
jgi:F-type H+-transporting ATPase subunit c